MSYSPCQLIFLHIFLIKVYLGSFKVFTFFHSRFSHFFIQDFHILFSGVVKAMEAAIEFLKMGTLEGKTVAIQGAGNVGKWILVYILKLF